MGIKRLRATVFLLALVAAWCLAGGAAWAATVIDIGTYTGTWPIVINKTTYPDGEVRFTGTKVNAGDVKGIQVHGSGPGTSDTFKITFADGFHLTNRPGAFQVVNGAVVDMIIEGTVTFKTQSFGGDGGDAMIQCGEVEKAVNGAKPTTAASTLNIIGADSDRSKNILIIDEEGYSGAGIDAIRASEFTVQDNVLSFKNVAIRANGMLGSNRGICGDTNKDVVFDNCDIQIHGGIPIAGGRIYGGSPCRAFASFHFINCALSLESTFTGGSTGAINLLQSDFFTDDRKTWGREVIFCDTQDNIAILKATGANDAVKADSVFVAGGAVRLTAESATNQGVNAKHINIVSQDKDHHPNNKEDQGSIIFYVDKTNVGEIHVDDTVNAIVASKNNRRDETTPEYQDWSARTPASGTGSYTIGNVVGDFELFDTRIDKTVLGEPDYTIHDGEVIIVDKGNTLTINDMSKFVIEKDGHLVLIGDGNINDGVIEVHGRTDDELKQMIRDEFGGKLGGSGSILNADTGTMLTNSGTSWDELVDNTDTAERAKINNDGTPNLVVFGKNDTTGKDALVAVNPKTKDAPYLVPLNERLDLKVVITEPGNDKKVQNTSSHNGKFMSAAVWPLDASGNPLGPVDTASRVPTINPLPVTKISGGMTQFTLSEDDIRKLREYAKQNGLQEFVIWVYEVDTINDTDYNGTGLKMPFVFKVDSPEHTFSTSVPADQKSNIVQDANTLVRVNVTQQAGTPLAEYRALNPTRSDVISLTENEDVLPEVYIARNAGDTKLNTNSGFEGKSVLASIRPYDGLSMSQYKGLGDFIESDGPKPITDGYAGFQFDYKSLHRWARRLRLREFVVYLRDVETNGGLIESEFVVRLGEADVDTHGTHCAGCDTGVGIALAAGALAVVAMRRRKES